MLRKSIFIFWLILAWVAPAAIAGALGWSSVWGSGSAFADYLIPVPVAGGVLHWPSFILVSMLLLTQPWGGWLAGQGRAILLAGALVGVAMLLDLNKLQLAAATGVAGGSPWQQQPLGLFILTDCVIAQLFVGSFGGRWPRSLGGWALSLIAALAIPLSYAAVSLKADPRQKNPFVLAGSYPGQQRGDEMVFYYSKLSTGEKAFRHAAQAVVPRYDPRNNINTEDVAIYFFDSLAAAQARKPGAAGFTICLYQDGTPTVWSVGSVDCFGGHESFSERFEKASRGQSTTLPQEVRSWLGRREACAGRKPMTAPPGVHLDNVEVRLCDPASTERARQELLKRFEADANAVAALR
jgi:hypothetical protein